MTACLTQSTAAPRDVEIDLCRLDDDSDMPLDAAARWLSPAEADRARRFRFARDRDRFVRGRGFLRRSLAASLGCDPRRVAIAENPGSKPRLPGAELSFSLSHSGGLAALATSSAWEIGIDIELLAPVPALVGDLGGTIDACFHPDEAAAIRSAPAPRARFLQFWTAKEARMKLTGEGLGLEPRAIALALADGRPVGYLAPARPAATLHGLDLVGAVGSLAVAQERPTCSAIH